MTITKKMRYWMAMCKSSRQLYGNRMPWIHGSGFTSFSLSQEGRELMDGLGSTEERALNKEMSDVFPVPKELR